ncbi:hypothetical protein BKA70DRAFT_1488265 [Coprinopsis sp. MPI-PUGE-AT-0042]|nr:hypothetical protein BKA70DRAFT_1488265 [Coprinopsis sp. MPI-PUGE-AT-0042]
MGYRFQSWLAPPLARRFSTLYRAQRGQETFRKPQDPHGVSCQSCTGSELSRDPNNNLRQGSLGTGDLRRWPGDVSKARQSGLFSTQTAHHRRHRRTSMSPLLLDTIPVYGTVWTTCPDELGPSNDPRLSSTLQQGLRSAQGRSLEGAAVGEARHVPAHDDDHSDSLDDPRTYAHSILKKPRRITRTGNGVDAVNFRWRAHGISLPKWCMQSYHRIHGFFNASRIPEKAIVPALDHAPQACHYCRPRFVGAATFCSQQADKGHSVVETCGSIASSRSRTLSDHHNVKKAIILSIWDHGPDIQVVISRIAKTGTGDRL